MSHEVITEGDRLRLKHLLLLLLHLGQLSILRGGGNSQETAKCLEPITTLNFILVYVLCVIGFGAQLLITAACEMHGY